VIVGGANLACCCDDSEPACSAIPHASAPDQVVVSVSYTYEWETDWWALVESREPSYVPEVNVGTDANGNPIFECANTGQPADCDNGLCFDGFCTRFTMVKIATYSASLTVQASGVLDKTLSQAWDTFPKAPLYRGQLEFDYDFASDHPGTAGASGIVTPASFAWPGNLANADGMLCEIVCEKRETGVARGLCKPYSGLFVADDPDSVVAAGSHIGLSISIPEALLTTQSASMPPSTDPIDADPNDPDNWPPFAPNAIGFSQANQFQPWPGRVAGFQKLQPWQHHFVRQNGPVLGSYVAARTASSGLVLYFGTTAFPSTRSEIGCALSKDTCGFPPANYWNSACAMDPDRGPRQGGQSLCRDKDCDGTQIVASNPAPGICNPPYVNDCGLCSMAPGSKLIEQNLFVEQCVIDGGFLIQSWVRGIPKLARGRLASYSATVST
jgi:hypothetical protein